MKNKKERGEVMVEATVILPIAILCVILLLYVSLFLYQKAVLQASLETSVIYFKNTLTDNYVVQNEQMSYASESDGVRAIGNQYKQSGPLNPYAKFTTFNKKVSDKGFEKYFKSVSSGLLFDENLHLGIDYSNYILFKEIEVTAEQVVKFPIDFSIIGISDTVNLSATARVAVVDHDELIRNMDYAVDLLEDTEIGEMAQKIATRIVDVYNKMRECLG